jgi:hypothetical protein
MCVDTHTTHTYIYIFIYIQGERETYEYSEDLVAGRRVSKPLVNSEISLYQNAVMSPYLPSVSLLGPVSSNPK